MKWLRSNADERQKIEAMHVASKAFWILYLGLVISIVVQVIFLGRGWSFIAGEFILMIIGMIYTTIGFCRRGIWDFITKPGVKSYLMYSFIASLFAVPISIAYYFRANASLSDSLLMFAKSSASMFILCFVLLAVIGTLVKKKQKKLAEKFEDE